MQVLIVSQYYLPEPAKISVDVANEISGRGHTVRVLTAYPNYPMGRIYPGYRQRWRSIESHQGVELLRVPLFIDHSQSTIRRILNYATFALTSASARKFARHADVIYVYATQMTPALGPWLWRMSGGAPYVLHVQDLWPDSITGSSLSGGGPLTRLIERVLNPWITRVYRRASAVIGIAPTMVETLIERGVPAERAELIYNWGPEEAYRNCDAEVHRAAKSIHTHLVYAGNIGDMQDLDTVIRAAVATEDEGILLTVIGEGVAKQRLIDLSHELGASNIVFRDAVSSDQIADVYAGADFALVTLKDLPAFRGTVPSKFQAALAHRLPVITTVQGDVRNLTELYGLGFTADTESVDDLTIAFQKAALCSPQQYAAMVAQTSSVTQQLFSRQAAIDRIEVVLRQAAEEGKIKT